MKQSSMLKEQQHNKKYRKSESKILFILLNMLKVDDTDGWPDRICIQCVHQVSRCHAFKSRVEKSDQELRQYIKGITVIVEEQIELQPQPQQQTQPQSQQLHQIQTHQITRADTQNPHHVHIQVQPQIQHTNHRRSQQQQQQQPQQQQQHHHQQQQRQIIRAEIAQHNDLQPQQMIITNGQLHNAQIINAGQIVTTSQGQQIVQTGTQNVQAGQNVQLCQLVTTSNGTMQVIQPNGQPAQVVQIQRTSDDRCEIIVQPDIQGDTQYYTEDGKL